MLVPFTGLGVPFTGTYQLAKHPTTAVLVLPAVVSMFPVPSAATVGVSKSTPGCPAMVGDREGHGAVPTPGYIVPVEALATTPESVAVPVVAAPLPTPSR